MSTSYRLLAAALLSSMTLFACAGGASSTQRGAVDPSDDAAWHPGERTELSFGSSASTTERASHRGEIGPVALRPNTHDAPRGSLYDVKTSP